MIFLRWVFRVSNSAVGKNGKPFGVRRSPRVVRGALQREIERYLEIEFTSPGNKRIKIVESAKVGVNRVMATLR